MPMPAKTLMMQPQPFKSVTQLNNAFGEESQKVAALRFRQVEVHSIKQEPHTHAITSNKHRFEQSVDDSPM